MLCSRLQCCWFLRSPLAVRLARPPVLVEVGAGLNDEYSFEYLCILMQWQESRAGWLFWWKFDSCLRHQLKRKRPAVLRAFFVCAV